MLRSLDVFAGIGNFTLAAKMVGHIETLQFVEIDKYCQKILNKHYPYVPIHSDIRTYKGELGSYDLITGGFPCLDISSQNPKGLGLDGPRSGLFYELVRVIREVRPKYLLLENVVHILYKDKGRHMGRVLWELQQAGYDVEWATISAESVGAPHLRERVWFVGYRSDLKNTYSHSTRFQELFFTPISETQKQCTRLLTKTGTYWQHKPRVDRVLNGSTKGIHRTNRVRVLGNSIVPQVAAIPLTKIVNIDKLIYEIQNSKDC